MRVSPNFITGRCSTLTEIDPAEEDEEEDDDDNVEREESVMVQDEYALYQCEDAQNLSSVKLHPPDGTSAIAAVTKYCKDKVALRNCNVLP